MAEHRDEDQRREAQAKLDALLQEGWDSGVSTPMTTEDWSDIRREVRLATKAEAICADESRQTAQATQH